MSDGRGGPDVPRPENDASVPSHGTTPDVGGGFTDPPPGGDGIIVQGGRTASGSHDPARAIGPKQDDPRAIGPKQDDPRSVGKGIIVQGGRTGHPDEKARQKRAKKKKTKTMALIIGGVLVVAAGGVFVGQRLGHDPAVLRPQAVATPSGAASAGAPGATTAPTASPDSGSGSGRPAPATSPGAPATKAGTPTAAASNPPARGGNSPSPARTSQPPKQSGARGRRVPRRRRLSGDHTGRPDRTAARRRPVHDRLRQQRRQWPGDRHLRMT
ncbi:hypothetical protein ACFXPI_21045 [Streptomyces sp. NPDC059104]|uniref:hypothetical protein n=1 Tax=Streptomyces sp. NPDC059104 TaxID=3346729 RepID=UPI0036794120